VESWVGAVNLVGRQAGSRRDNQGSTRDGENTGITENLGCMMYLVYAVLGVCCTRCVLYSVLTDDHGMEKWRKMT